MRIEKIYKAVQDKVSSGECGQTWPEIWTVLKPYLEELEKNRRGWQNRCADAEQKIYYSENTEPEQPPLAAQPEPGK